MADAGVVLGVDGGGSKSLAALCDRGGRVVACHWRGGTNPFDQPDWHRSLTELLAESCAARAPVAAAAGLAGYGEVAAVTAEQDSAMARWLACPHSAHNDVQIAYDGAFLDAAGVLVLAGSGSMAWAQAPGRGVVRVGGWGSGVGDAGSALWIGQRAIEEVSRVLDGRSPRRGFARPVLAAMGLAESSHTAAALLSWYHGRADRRSAVAALAQAVDLLAEQGEAFALALLEQAAEELCCQVVTARRRIGLVGGGWSHAGRVFASAALRGFMQARLGPPTPPRLPPVGGALWRAAMLAGWAPDAAWVEALSLSLEHFSGLAVEAAA